MAVDLKYGIVTAEHGGVTHGGPGVPLNQSDEPCIIFRAQDRFALAAIDGYIEVVSNSNLTDDFYSQLEEVRSAFVKWQDENPDNVKLPD